MRLAHAEARSGPKPETQPIPVTTTFFTLPTFRLAMQDIMSQI
jgi:hypothetical protein